MPNLVSLPATHQHTMHAYIGIRWDRKKLEPCIPIIEVACPPLCQSSLHPSLQVDRDRAGQARGRCVQCSAGTAGQGDPAFCLCACMLLLQSFCTNNACELKPGQKTGEKRQEWNELAYDLSYYCHAPCNWSVSTAALVAAAALLGAELGSSMAAVPASAAAAARGAEATAAAAFVVAPKPW